MAQAIDFQRNMTRERGWELLKNLGLTTPLSPGDLKLVPILRGNETSITFDEMFRRAEETPVSDQCQAEYFLGNQNDIPSAWRRHRLIFCTMWGDGEGVRYIVCLRYDEKKKVWVIEFPWSRGGGLVRDDRWLCKK